MTKTNVMRLLDAAKIPYRAAEYAVDENDLNGMHAAEGIGMHADALGGVHAVQVVFVDRVFRCAVWNFRRVEQAHHVGFCHLEAPLSRPLYLISMRLARCKTHAHDL